MSQTGALTTIQTSGATKVGKGLLDFLILDDLNTLADKNASGLDKGVALASFIPVGKVLKIPKAIDKIVDSNVGEVVKKSDVDEGVGKGAGKYNTDTMKHIYHGDINKRGKAVGYHHVSMMGGKIIPGTEKIPDKNGVYMAKVEVDGVRKVADSSFFPKEWNRVDVLKAIDEAYETKQQIGSNKYKGVTSTGIKIEMYLNKDGSIATAYPLYKK